MIYAHLPPYEVRPKVKPRIWKSRYGYWVCATRKHSLESWAAKDPQEAFELWAQHSKQFN